VRDAEFSLTPFICPYLIELERGTIVKRVIRIAPLFFKREGKGGIRESKFR